MGQLNVSFDDALLIEIDRLAAQRGINRPELLRMLVREAISAEGKGIEVAAPVHRTASMAQAPDMMGQLMQMSIDLDRVLRDADRRESRLRKRAVQDDDAQLQALQSQFALFHGQVRDAFNWFSDHQQSETAKALGEMGKHLDQLIQSVHQTRPNVIYQVGKDWKLSKLAILAWGWLICGFILVLVLGFARLAPDALFAVPMARGMFGSNERAACIMSGGEYYGDECHRKPIRGYAQ